MHAKTPKLIGDIIDAATFVVENPPGRAAICDHLGHLRLIPVVVVLFPSPSSCRRRPPIIHLRPSAPGVYPGRAGMVHSVVPPRSPVSRLPPPSRPFVSPGRAGTVNP